MVAGYFLCRIQMGYQYIMTWCFLEVGHTRFHPDTSGRLFQHHEKNRDHKTHEELLKFIDESTPQTGRKFGVTVTDDELHDLSKL